MSAGALATASVDEVLAVGQVWMLETQPDVLECVIVARGRSIPARPGCRTVFVSDEQAVQRSAIRTNRRILEIDPGCIVVQFDRKSAANATNSELQPSMDDGLQAANASLDDLYAQRSQALHPDALDAEIGRSGRPGC